jgi:hypothetical protein
LFAPGATAFASRLVASSPRSIQRMQLRIRLLLCSSFFCLTAAALSAMAWADDTSDAEQLLKSAQDAYAKKDWPVAATRFREVVTKYAKTASQPAAWFGLAVCLVDGHDNNYAEAQKLL